MSEIAIYQPRSELVPLAASPRGELDDWIMVADQVCRLAEVICRSPFVPDGLRGSAPATAAAILTGRELGIPPMTSLANIHVIHGKPGLSALVMRGLVMREGHDWEDVEVNNTRVVLRGKRKGASAWTTASFSTADAATAKLQLGGYPQDKLYARASARLARRAFADVIAGMPYSIEELEDGVTPDEDGAAAETAPPPADPKPGTARRSRAPRTAPPADQSAPAVTTQAASTPEDAGGALPPLPGEEWDGSGPPPPLPGAADSPLPDDRDYDTPGTAAVPQITAIWTVLGTHFQFGKDEKDQARMVCAQIIGRDLESTKNLSRNEAKVILDTLGHWRAQAEAKGDDTRAYLIQMLAMAEEARHGE